MNKPVTYPGVTRVFNRDFVPFITNEFFKVAPISYAQTKNLANTWRTQCGFDSKIADHLSLQSKLFLRLNFQPNDPRVNDIRFLDALTNLMIEYLMPYYVQNDKKMPKDAIFDLLKDKLFTKNSLVVVRKAKIAKKQKKTEKLTPRVDENRAKEALAQIVESYSIEGHILPETKKKRPRIQAKVNIDEHIKIQNALIANTQTKKK